MAIATVLHISYRVLVITPAQCRAARALLGMTQAALSAASGVSLPVLKRFERGSDPRASTVNAIERALVAAGVTLIDDSAFSPTGGAGVRLTQPAGDGEE